MTAQGGAPERTGRHLARWDVSVPRTRPPKPVPIDLDALAEFNAGTAKARAAYYYDTRGEAHQPNPPKRKHRR